MLVLTKINRSLGIQLSQPQWLQVILFLVCVVACHLKKDAFVLEEKQEEESTEMRRRSERNWIVIRSQGTVERSPVKYEALRLLCPQFPGN
jgi:hypothetical protein